jgi:hypothetical protein
MPLALVTVALAAGGCGGGSVDARSAGPLPSGPFKAKSGGPLPPSPPPLPVVAKADAICRRLNTQIQASKQTSLSPKEIARFAPRNAALEKAALKRLSKLKPPTLIKHDWRQVMAYRRTLMEQLVKLGKYAKVNNSRAIKALTKSKKQVHLALLTIGTLDGFKDCTRTG